MYFVYFEMSRFSYFIGVLEDVLYGYKFLENLGTSAKIKLSAKQKIIVGSQKLEKMLPMLHAKLLFTNKVSSLFSVR